MEKLRARTPSNRSVTMQDLTWGEYTPIAVGANMAKLAKEGINFAVAVEVPFFREKKEPKIEVGLP